MEDLIFIVLIVAISLIIKYGIDEYSNYKRHELAISRKFRENEIKLKQKEELLLQTELKLRKKEQDINKIINDETQNASWLTNRFIDYLKINDDNIINYLKNKPRPALKAAQIISEMSKEKNKYCREAKKLQYNLDYLVHIFPMLEDAMQLNTHDLERAIFKMKKNSEQKDEYETVKQWLSPEEYTRLSNTEKYQLALDRYLKSYKSPWQIGIAYERYIGYIYENKGYSIIANGALKGFEDFGRDIIAENEEEILIIQCKYWRKERVIRENHIFQLYGTTILKEIELEQENKKAKKVKGILITSTTLSTEARMVADKLGIKLIENEDFNKEYPCIKCNINITTKEKIYHLPFDQQYDNIKIVSSIGEKYVSTVKEAEELGFRRAKRHLFDKKV